MRQFLAVLAVALDAGCGSGAPPVAAPRSGAPTGPPPQLDGDAPPPAWIETAAGGHWLAYGSYCWGSTCADYSGSGERDDVPTIAVREGEPVTFHLGFEPRHLSVGPEGGEEPSSRLRPRRTAQWSPAAEGAFWLFVRAAPGEDGADASYVFKLVFRE